MRAMRWIAFGTFSFSQIGGSRSAAISIMRKSLVDPDEPESQPSEVFHGQSSAAAPPISYTKLPTELLLDSRESLRDSQQTILLAVLGPAPSTFAVIPAQVTAPPLSESTFLFTTTSAVRTTISGQALTTNVLVTGTSTTFVPAPTGQVTTTHSSIKNPNIVAGASIGAAMIILGLFVCAILRRRVLQARFSAWRSPKEIGKGEDIGTTSDSGSDVNCASWAPYLSRSQSPDRTGAGTPTHSRTISTHQLYISNQMNRARDKRRRISSGNRAESPEKIGNPFHSDADLDHASWEPYLDRVSSSAASTISTRQLYISNQVNRAREKVIELEEISMLLRLSSQSSHTSSTVVSSWTDQDVQHSAADAEPTSSSRGLDPLEVQNKFERAIHQIEALNARINELERQRRSSWALGRSADPPPGYTEE
ncbi:hypothetical protein FB451DRAFT_1290883 [Mycena latifolia]|nr:hypothetical protein FB451DRAFT_1290883 [Mycena latifolia]